MCLQGIALKKFTKFVSALKVSDRKLSNLAFYIPMQASATYSASGLHLAEPNFLLGNRQDLCRSFRDHLRYVCGEMTVSQADRLTGFISVHYSQAD